MDKIEWEVFGQLYKKKEIIVANDEDYGEETHVKSSNFNTNVFPTKTSTAFGGGFGSRPAKRRKEEYSPNVEKWESSSVETKHMTYIPAADLFSKFDKISMFRASV